MDSRSLTGQPVLTRLLVSPWNWLLLKLASVPAQCTLSPHLYCWCPLRPEHLCIVHTVASAAGAVLCGLSISVLGILSSQSISAGCMLSLWLLVCVLCGMSISSLLSFHSTSALCILLPHSVSALCILSPHSISALGIISPHSISTLCILSPHSILWG